MARRRRRENPIGGGSLLLGLLGVGVVGGVGYVIYKNQQAAATTPATSAAAPTPVSLNSPITMIVAQTIPRILTLAPGAQSITAPNTGQSMTVQLPTGGTWAATGSDASNMPSIPVLPTSGNATLQWTGDGSTGTATFAWNDSSGTAQTSDVTFTQSGAGGPLSVTLAAGSQTVTGPNNGQSITVQLPTGASWTDGGDSSGMSAIPTPLPTTGSAPVTWTGDGTSGTATFAWTDSSMQPQTSNVTFSPTAPAAGSGGGTASSPSVQLSDTQGANPTSLSFASGTQVTISLPSGDQWDPVQGTSTVPGLTLPNTGSSTGPITFTYTGPGSATLYWNDSGGNSNQATIAFSNAS